MHSVRKSCRNPKTYPYHGQVNEGESEEAQRLRFQVELEFIQCLANPNYLLFLAQRGYFKEQNFINYLKYLTYWKEPEYAKFLKYPMCLYFLDLLQHESFRKEIVNGQCAKFIDDQAILHWQHYTRKRMKLLEHSLAQQGSQTPASTEQKDVSSGIISVDLRSPGELTLGAARGIEKASQAATSGPVSQQQQQQQQQPSGVQQNSLINGHGLGQKV